MCADCEFKNTLDEIEELLEDEDSLYAEDTLTGIKEWIERNEHVTENQKTAVNNIKKGSEIRAERRNR